LCNITFTLTRTHARAHTHTHTHETSRINCLLIETRLSLLVTTSRRAKTFKPGAADERMKAYSLPSVRVNWLKMPGVATCRNDATAGPDSSKTSTSSYLPYHCVVSVVAYTEAMQITGPSPYFLGDRSKQRFAICYGTIVLSVCLSVTYCDQTVGWIKMPLGTEVGLCRGGIVLDGDPAPPWKEAQQSTTFWPMSRLLWSNGRPSQQLLSSCYKVYDTVSQVSELGKSQLPCS